MCALIAVLLVHADDKKLKDLQQERITVLEKLVEQTATRFRSAQGSYQDVLEAQMELLQARLDAAEKDSERIELYTKAVELLKQTERVAQAQHQAGAGTEVAVLKVRARRLGVEIQLEKAKRKK